MARAIRCSRRGWMAIAFLVARWISTSYVPSWWQQGWPQEHLDSVAEGELLAPLADLLMPQMPIRELFRIFPAPEDWGGVSLQPDLAAHGVLRKKDAALFVEYDGYYLHGEKAGVARDKAKNAALLAFAPEGSLVIRISHTTKRALRGNVLWMKVDPWRQGDRKTLSKTLTIILQKVMNAVGELLRPDVLRRMQQAMQLDMFPISARALDFVNEARVRGCGNTTQEIADFLVDTGFSIKDADLMLGAGLNGKCIKETLQPRIHWLLCLGLTKGQVAKAVAGFPQLLGYSIEQNLQPTEQWLLTLGLTKGQVAKAIAGFPPLLGCSIEQNLQPTVQWLLSLGLTKGQVAKAVAGSPQLLGCSIEQNLQPTEQWLLTLGLTKGQVAKAVAGFPKLLGCSIEQNLQPTVQWLLSLGLTKGQVAKAVAGFPPLLGYSIEQNLQPTVQWLLTLGLTKGQVAKAVAGFSPIAWMQHWAKLAAHSAMVTELGTHKGSSYKGRSWFSPIAWLQHWAKFAAHCAMATDLGINKGSSCEGRSWFSQIAWLQHWAKLAAHSAMVTELGTHKGSSCEGRSWFSPIAWIQHWAKFAAHSAMATDLGINKGSSCEGCSWFSPIAWLQHWAKYETQVCPATTYVRRWRNCKHDFATTANPWIQYDSPYWTDAHSFRSQSDCQTALGHGPDGGQLSKTFRRLMLNFNVCLLRDAINLYCIWLIFVTCLYLFGMLLVQFILWLSFSLGQIQPNPSLHALANGR